VSPKGTLGVELKALAAAGHFLLARCFMYRTVYYHKTTYAFEEACRQLLRRLRDQPDFGLPRDGNEVYVLCKSDELANFTDEYVDRAIRTAVHHADPVTQALARSITSRQPPKLVHEVCGLFDKAAVTNRTAHFDKMCRHNLAGLAARYSLPVGQFLLCGPKPIEFEERGSRLTVKGAQGLAPEEREEIINVFDGHSDEPVAIVEIPDSLISQLSTHHFAIRRLYVIDSHPDAKARLEAIRQEVRAWAD